MREARLPRLLQSGLAWLAPAVAVGLSPVYAFLLAGSGAPPQRLIGWAVNGLLFLAFPLVGGLIATRRPEHPIGWLMGAGSGLILLDQLTPQEFQIAQVLAQGVTTREAAVKLFLAVAGLVRAPAGRPPGRGAPGGSGRG